MSVEYSTFKLIHAYGNPVGVLNAGRKRFPKSSARPSSWLLYDPCSNFFEESDASKWAEIRPPRTLMLHWMIPNSNQAIRKTQ
jgi:hypothetical protein